MSVNANRAASDPLPPAAHSTLEEGSVFSFKNRQAGVEQLAVGNDDDIEPRRDLVTTEDLSYQSFRSVSLDRAADFFRRGDAQASDRLLIC